LRAFGLAALLAATLPAQAAISVIDDTGATVTVPRPVQRVISLAPHATELLFAAGGGGSNAVFVETNGTTGNAILAYRRADDGTLTQVENYPTGGLGGAASGAAVDPLASQGALGYDSAHGLLLAVNAGSDSVSVFTVDGDTLQLQQVIGSGGFFPASIAVSGDLVSRYLELDTFDDLTARRRD